MSPEDFQEQFGVSDEVLAHLKTYYALLKKWQKTINLIGPKTVDIAWQRHFFDSAQMSPLLPMSSFLNQKIVLTDLGSGAGFPGLVLAIIKPNLDVHLVESDERKAQFLRTVSRETNASVTIHNKRIEDMTPDVVPDVVTARALAPLADLLMHCEVWAAQNPALRSIFLKGKAADDELKQARQRYNFTCETHKSMTDEQARILFINSIKPR